MSSAESISPTALLRRLGAGESLRLLDIRTAAEFAGGHIAGSRNIPFRVFGRHVQSVADGRPAELVVICQSGAIAPMAAGMLRGRGRRGVVFLDGGQVGWELVGGAVEPGPAPWSIERQARLVTGSVLAGGWLGRRRFPRASTLVPGALGLVLVATALTNTVPLEELLSALPFNGGDPAGLDESVAALTA